MHSVYFKSNNLTRAENNYHNHALEAMTKLEALEKFRIFAVRKTM